MLQPKPKDDLVLGPIGNRVIFENDQVRVWELAVDPGKSKGVHRHELPYVIVPMTDGEIEIKSIDGSSLSARRTKVGEAIWRDAGEDARPAQSRRRRLSQRADRDQTASANSSRSRGCIARIDAMYENLLANVPTDLWIGGKWRKSSDGQRFDVIDPATENTDRHRSRARPSTTPRPRSMRRATHSKAGRRASRASAPRSCARRSS